LSKGCSAEVPVCESKEEATDLLEKLCARFHGGAYHCYTNRKDCAGANLWKHRFVDEGFFVVSSDKIAMTWFIGYD